MSAAEILDLEEARCRAMIAADATTLARLFDDDLVWTHASAHVDTKAAFLAKISGAAVRYVSMDRSDVEVRVAGTTAVSTGRVALNVVIAGEAMVLSNRYTDVWVRRADTWRMLAWQSTPAPSG